jgi:hypothetical protein
MLKAGDVFIGKYPPGSNKDRRIIVVTDEDADAQVAVVYLSTQLSDLTVTFEAGVHPCITESCCVVFDEATISDAELFRAGIAERLLTQHPSPLSSEQVANIQEGIFESAAERIAKFCTDRC